MAWEYCSKATIGKYILNYGADVSITEQDNNTRRLRIQFGSILTYSTSFSNYIELYKLLGEFEKTGFKEVQKYIKKFNELKTEIEKS